MFIKLMLGLVLGGVAASAAIFYFWDDEITDVLEDKIKSHRKYLEECLHASTGTNKNND